ncbi:MAG TPA: DNA-processing protein DprA [Pseudoxanthomonas sp.]|jgi:DNA processing protein|nr:DNA-processing protein DprA [Pseudoxanthomonas sp.]
MAAGALAPRRLLLDRHGSPAAALAAGPRAWRDAGLDAGQRALLHAPDAATLAHALDWLSQPGHHLLGWHEPDYPALLRRCSSPPVALFVDGDPTALWRPLVAIVGSRAATVTGRDHAAYFSRALVGAGLAVASGLASGIDAAAHEAALAHNDGCTVAVVGTGPDLTYPAHNRPLHRRIAGQGAVVSEFLPGTLARTSHFPSRNRILAALSLATLVVEAGEKSGALITARQAADCGREVFALPGSIRHPLARGCHQLIREGAGLVEEPADVIQALVGPARDLGHLLRARLHETESQHVPGSATPPSQLSPDYQCLWLALGPDPTPMDCLVDRTGLTVASLSSMLLGMELDGWISVEHGRYSRRS